MYNLPFELQAYLAMDWKIFPCIAKHHDPLRIKAPYTLKGFHDASNDRPQIQEWAEKHKDCAWGIATCAMYGVIDIDLKNGGDRTLAEMVAKHGPLPKTPTVRTGSGGSHYWLRFPPGTGSSQGFVPGIDRRAERGYAIAPPSRIYLPEHDRAYVWEVAPWNVPIADAPAWAAAEKVKTSASGSTSGKPKSDENPWVVKPSLDLLTHPGVDREKDASASRHDTLCHLVGIHLARGDSEASIFAMANAWNQRNNPPMSDDKVREHVQGLVAKERRKAASGGSQRLTGAYHLPSFEHDASNIRKEGNNSDAQDEDELFPSFPEKTANAENPKPEPELFPSFPEKMTEEKQSECIGTLSTSDTGTESNFPTLKPEAYHGLLGQMLKAIEPETEAHPAGILLGWLTCFGNIVGRNAWFQVGARRHHPALYVGVVGRTSDAKGDAWSVSVYPFQQIEAEWSAPCIAPGIGSGEGLIERVADEQMVIDKEGKAKVIPGAPDKRCLLRLAELSKCFKLGRRENASLSEYLREAWDGDVIDVPNRRGNALRTSNYAISMVGDITPQALGKMLQSGTEGFDGFMNRYLWTLVRRTSFLPSGGSVKVLEPFLKPLADALTSAKKAGEMRRDADAEALWQSVYPSLATTSDLVPHTDRARPYVVRLSMLYALADCSNVVKLRHLQAALAVWDYCRESARMLFGKPAKGIKATEPEPLLVQVLNAITKKPGVMKSELTYQFKNLASAEQVAFALAQLKAGGMAHCTDDRADGAGRPAERWWPGASGSGEVVDRQSPSTTCASDAGKEGNNSSDNCTRKEGNNSVAGDSSPEPRKEGNNSEPQPGAELIPSFPSTMHNGGGAEGSGGVNGSPVNQMHQQQCTEVHITDVSDQPPFAQPPKDATAEDEGDFLKCPLQEEFDKEPCFDDMVKEAWNEVDKD